MWAIHLKESEKWVSILRSTIVVIAPVAESRHIFLSTHFPTHTSKLTCFLTPCTQGQSLLWTSFSCLKLLTVMGLPWGSSGEGRWATQKAGSEEVWRAVTQGLIMQDQGLGIPHSKPSLPSRAGISPIDEQFPFCLFSNNASISSTKMNSKKLVSKRRIKKKKKKRVNRMGEVLAASMYAMLPLLECFHNPW